MANDLDIYRQKIDHEDFDFTDEESLDDLIARLGEWRLSLSDEKAQNAEVHFGECWEGGYSGFEVRTHRMETDEEVRARMTQEAETIRLRKLEAEMQAAANAVRKARELELNDPELFSQMRDWVDRMNCGEVS